ncbi:aldo/keto reductase [Phycicoccus sp. CMS6Z-2]|nr:aldo/keto reductase [Phycicoccus flavus]
MGNLFRVMPDAQARAVLDAAWECGIRSFDTAPHYGLGLAEQRLGAFLGTVGRERARVSTKVGRLLVPRPDGRAVPDTDIFAVTSTLTRRWDFSDAGVRASVEQSLERLGTDRLDAVYLHDPDESPDPPGALHSGLSALAPLHAAGTVGVLGVGTKSVAQMAAAAADDRVGEVMVAGRYTVLDRSARGELVRCSRAGVRVAVASVYASGLLASDEVAGTYGYRTAGPDVVRRARRVAEVCHRYGTDLPTAALRFAAQGPGVASVVLGARSPEQVRQSVARATAPIDPALWAALEELEPDPGPAR